MPLPDPPSLLLFLVAAVVLIVIPGPAVFYVVARSVAQGSVAGLISALGVGLGGLVHVAAAALGVSALVLASATAFTVLKYLGAAYLIYLAVRAFFARDEAETSVDASPRSMGRVFVDGAVVNILNPKTALFFLAFLPQFVDPVAGSVPVQMALLGLLFVVIAVLSDAAYACMAGGLAARLRSSARVRRLRRWLTGSVYMGLGVTAALSDAADPQGGGR